MSCSRESAVAAIVPRPSRIRKLKKTICAIAGGLLVAMSLAAFAQDNSPNHVLINNVNVWDGNSEALSAGMNVLVEDNLIKQISAE